MSERVIALEKAFSDKKEILQIWIVDGKPGPQHLYQAEYVYLQPVAEGVSRLVIDDGDGGFIGVVEEDGRFVIRSKATTGKALSFSEFVRQGNQELYLIWSAEHRLLWRPKAEGHTDQIEQAGRWPYAEAAQMTAHCGPEKGIRLCRFVAGPQIDFEKLGDGEHALPYPPTGWLVYREWRS